MDLIFIIRVYLSKVEDPIEDLLYRKHINNVANIVLVL